ncbi:hypothetical protein FEE96_15275 [Parasedimentitalea maritima]|uniref:DUF3313 domain-containing protein n=1 Tax=Parasedimentitalea maritima TaxID=2578117 RepID=A0ABY2UTR8_9RHOB|nr:hypothetical protein [Zongyanglinia marina]TLP61596.1 hypothetical protein FEE96_15275 [Zongyanglinia marina]
MFFRFFGCLLAVILAGCQTQMPEGFASELFPATANVSENERRFYGDWFGRHLFAMNEAGLGDAELSTDEVMIIRLLVLPSFDTPTVVRLTLKQDGSGLFVQKTSTGTGGYEPGRLDEVVEGDMSVETGSRIEAMVADFGVFGGALPFRAENPGETVQLDGTVVALEFRKLDKFVVAQRTELEVQGEPELAKLIAEIAAASGDNPLTKEIWNPHP